MEMTNKGKRAIKSILLFSLFMSLFGGYILYFKDVVKGNYVEELLFICIILSSVTIAHFIYTYRPEIKENNHDIVIGFITGTAGNMARLGLGRDNFISIAILSVLCLTFSAFLHCINGYNYKIIRYLRALKWNMSKYKKQINWLTGERDISPQFDIKLIKVNTIPQSPDSVSGNEYTRLDKQIRHFGKGTYRRKTEKHGMIVIGDFGTGKSTALLNYVKSQACMRLVCPNSIPVYVKLKDMLETEEIQNIIKSPEIFEIDMNKIRERAYTYSLQNNEQDDIKKPLNQLFQEGRILFLFDGLNELLLKTRDSKNERAQLAESIIRFIDALVLDNRFILTTCSHPDVITSRMMRYKKEDETEAIRTDIDIYVIKGVEQKTWKLIWNLIRKEDECISSHGESVALYWLCKDEKRKKVNNMDLDTQIVMQQYEDSKENGQANHIIHKTLSKYVKMKQRDGIPISEKDNAIMYKILDYNARREICKEQSHNLTAFVLLERYAQRKLTKEQKKIIEGHLIRLIETIMSQDNREGTLFPSFIINADSDLAYLREQPFFQKQEQADKFTTCHTLFYEYMIALYLRSILKDEKQFIKFLMRSEEQQEKSIEIIDQLHIRDAFKMLIVDVFVNGNEEEKENCKKRIKEMVDKVKSNDNVFYDVLLLLAKIKDEILQYTKDKRLDLIDDVVLKELLKKFETEQDNGKNSPIQKVMENGMGTAPNAQKQQYGNNFPILQFMVNKLVTDQTGQKHQYEQLLANTMNGQWTQIRIQRELFSYYLEQYKEWPKMDDKNFATYCMQEYQAEMLKINKYKDLINEEPKNTSYSFFCMRIKDIKRKLISYCVLFILLFFEIALFVITATEGIHYPAIITKAIGCVILFIALFAGIKQFVKNEEYYGWALGNFSRDEPIYEVLRDFLGEKADDKKAAVIIGDWFKNRPSIIFLLISVVTVLFTHNLFPKRFISPEWSFVLEILIAFVLLKVICFPHSTGNYLDIIGKTDIKRGTYNKTKIVMSIIFIILFVIPIGITTIAANMDKALAGFLICIIGLALLGSMYICFFQRMERTYLHEISILELVKDIVVFLFFALLFLVPGLIYCTINTESIWISSGSLSFIALAVFVYLFLLYFSYSKMKWRDNRDERVINSIIQNIEEGTGKNIHEYNKLSSKGQVKLLNILAARYENILLSNKEMLWKEAKTTQVIDILLDAQI